MCTKARFFVCEHCKNIIGLIKDSGVNVVCCGEKMKELKANTVDASAEKHVPEVTVEGNKVTVKVGSVTHPMLEEHFIEWIYLVTKQGVQRKCLKPGDEPVATFALAEDDEVVEAYEFCNLHSLWKKEL